MSKQDVVITAKSDEVAGSAENTNWTIIQDAPDVVMSLGDYEAIELTICDTEGE